MATYLKRTSKLFDVPLSQASTEMNLRDVICPVCRGILIEPVTLPCTHNLCLRCLNGTFEHNSLSCPLCRVRVGSWLRSATKSETLINSELWDLIRSRFPKEIESKYNDRDNEITADGYPPKIISAAGEIRREYEIQLQIAEEEMRIQRKADIMANEALIRKLQKKDEQQLAQYAQDQLLAKTLAKKQLLTKEKNGTLYNNFPNFRMSSDEFQILPLSGGPSIDENEPIFHAKKKRTNIPNMDANSCKLGESSQQSGNLVLDLKLAANRKECCQGPMSVHNVVTLKHQSVLLIQKTNCHYSEPSCSNSKIYGTRSEEELHVPSDVLSSSKSLGVEFCITTIKNDNERIGSAESAGSHDSINQEIHHFKPIKAMPRTLLKYSQDGRQIDPKLLRVVPILERVSNVIPKPPAPSKRIIGCSWSAFRGKIQQNPRPDCTAHLNASSSTAQPHQTSELSKPETVRKIDLAQAMSFDQTKSYTRGINRILNGTKVSKKLILDDETEYTADETWKLHMKNGLAEKTKKHTNQNKEKELSADENFSPCFIEASLKIPSTDDDGAAIENIAERIKKRKLAEPQTIDSIVENVRSLRKPRSRTAASRTDEMNIPSTSKGKVLSKSKHLKVQFNNETKMIGSLNVEDDELKMVKPSRKSSRSKSKERIGASSERMEEAESEDLDDVAIQEQRNIERLLRQEKEDYELAQRLQSQFNEIESISCRTRGSKRALKSCEGERGIHKIKISDRLLVNARDTASTSSRIPKSRRRQTKDY